MNLQTCFSVIFVTLNLKIGRDVKDSNNISNIPKPANPATIIVSIVLGLTLTLLWKL